MRNIKEYLNCRISGKLNEGYDAKILQEVTVKYGVHNKDIVIEQPEDYLEDNMMIYLQDTVGDASFTGPDYAEDFFGKNANNISDTYFEWSGYDDDTNDPIDLPFDKHYDTNGGEDKSLRKVKYKNFYYVVKFAKFELLDQDDTDIKETLLKIFERPISEEYTWPIKFELDYHNIEYK